MKIRVSTIVVLLLAGVFAGEASADWHSFWHSVHINYARNRNWPEPFTEIDAIQTMAPFEVMKHNGWRAHNTIGNDLFRRGDGALLAAGRERVSWIARQAPGNRRVVYVLQGENDDETKFRVDAVRESLDRMTLHDGRPQVLVTTKEPATAPGPWAQKVNRERLNQMPAPVLPNTSAAGTAGITTASGSNGTP